MKKVSVLQEEKKQPFFHQRRRMLFTAIFSIILLVSIVLTGLLLDKTNIATNLIERNASPSWSHLFGTDWLGRDMFARTMMRSEERRVGKESGYRWIETLDGK